MRSDKKHRSASQKTPKAPPGRQCRKDQKKNTQRVLPPAIPPDVLSARPLPAGGQCRKEQKKKTLRECFRWVDDAERFAEMSQLQGFATAGGLCARQGSKTRQMAISVESGGVGHPAGRTLRQAPSGGRTMPEGAKEKTLRECFRWVDDAERFAEMSQLQGFATAGGLCARQGSKTRQMAISVESGGVGHPAGRTLHQKGAWPRSRRYWFWKTRAAYAALSL